MHVLFQTEFRRVVDVNIYSSSSLADVNEINGLKFWDILLWYFCLLDGSFECLIFHGIYPETFHLHKDHCGMDKIRYPDGHKISSVLIPRLQLETQLKWGQNQFVLPDARRQNCLQLHSFSFWHALNGEFQRIHLVILLRQGSKWSLTKMQPYYVQCFNVYMRR